MIDIERTTHADLPPVAAHLGTLAAHCELRAARPGLDAWERKALLRQARTYRAAQLVELETQAAVAAHPAANALLERRFHLNYTLLFAAAAVILFLLGAVLWR